MFGIALVRVVQQIREDFPIKVSEWAPSLICVLWGFWVQMEPVTLTPDRFTLMLMIMPEAYWGVIAFYAGIARLFILLMNGTLRRSPWLRAVAAASHGLLWLLVSLALFSSTQITTGLAVYPVLGLVEFYTVMRLAPEAKRADDRLRHGGNGPPR